MTAYLSASPGFTAHIATASGSFESKLPLVKRGTAYVSGDGSGTVNIHTASGDTWIGGADN